MYFKSIEDFVKLSLTEKKIKAHSMLWQLLVCQRHDAKNKAQNLILSNVLEKKASEWLYKKVSW